MFSISESILGSFILKKMLTFVLLFFRMRGYSALWLAFGKIRTEGPPWLAWQWLLAQVITEIICLRLWISPHPKGKTQQPNLPAWYSLRLNRHHQQWCCKLCFTCPTQGILKGAQFQRQVSSSLQKKSVKLCTLKVKTPENLTKPMSLKDHKVEIHLMIIWNHLG